MIDHICFSEMEFNVETMVIQVDFSAGRSIFEKISESIRGKEIGILGSSNFVSYNYDSFFTTLYSIVNNVGVMYEMPMELPELSQDVIWQHVNVNMGSLTMMCWIVLPQMLERRKGAIINLSSSSALGPLPYMNVYSASKVLFNEYVI